MLDQIVDKIVGGIISALGMGFLWLAKSVLRERREAKEEAFKMRKDLDEAHRKIRDINKLLKGVSE